MKSSKAREVPPDFSFITHTETRHLRWATIFAALVAFSRRRDEMSPADLLAGIYVANLERVSKFWPDPVLLDDFIAEHCDWSEPRWATWQRWEDESRRASKAAWRWQLPFRVYLLRRGKPSRPPKRFFGSNFTQSPDLRRLFETGEKLTPHKVTDRGKLLPLLTPEIMLLAFIRMENIPLGKHLRDTGLLADKLEESAMHHLEKPEKLMF